MRFSSGQEFVTCSGLDLSRSQPSIQQEALLLNDPEAALSWARRCPHGRPLVGGFDGINDDRPIHIPLPRSSVSSQRLEYRQTLLPSPTKVAQRAQSEHTSSAHSKIEDSASGHPQVDGDGEIATPQTEASPAKHAFPFPAQNHDSLSPLLLRRTPSVLRQPGSHASTPSCSGKRNSGSQSSPDRFIPNRSSQSPFRERYVLSLPPNELTPAEKRRRQQSPLSDPLNGVVRRRRNNADLPSASPSPRPTPSFPDVTGPQAVQAADRAVSHGAVWGVGGSAPAFSSVRSISDGRGGRIASGTNAPMYYANFGEVKEDTDDQQEHQRRVALAFEVDQARRVLESPGSPTRAISAGPGFTRPQIPCPASGKGTEHSLQWRDCEWTRSGNPSCPLSDRCIPRLALLIVCKWTLGL